MIDLKRLEGTTANIGDMALRRRIKTIVEYLKIRPTDRILDCGDGYYIAAINHLRDCHLYGFDLDEKEIGLAKRNIVDDSLKLTRGDICHLPYKNNSFDKIILSEVLEHVPDDLRALREEKRVLKKGGFLIITVPNHNYSFLWDPVNKILEFLFKRHIQKGFWSGIWNKHLRLYSIEEIKELVEKSGFRIIDIKVLTHYCLPFNHLILNGLKCLMVRGIIPSKISSSMDRISGIKKTKQNNRFDPILLIFKVLNKFDKLNGDILTNKFSVAIEIIAKRV